MTNESSNNSITRNNMTLVIVYAVSEVFILFSQKIISWVGTVPFSTTESGEFASMVLAVLIIFLAIPSALVINSATLFFLLRKKLLFIGVIITLINIGFTVNTYLKL